MDITKNEHEFYSINKFCHDYSRESYYVKFHCVYSWTKQYRQGPSEDVDI